MVTSTLSPYSPRSAWQPWSRAVRRPTARCQWHSHRVDWQALAPSTPPGARYAVRASRFVFLGRGAPVKPLLIALIQNRGADRGEPPAGVVISAGADNGGERDRCHGSRGPTAKSRHPDGNHGKALVSVPDHHPHRDRQCGPYRHAGVMSRDVEDHCLEYGAGNVRSRRGTFVRAGAAVECNHGDNSVRVGAMTEPA